MPFNGGKNSAERSKYADRSRGGRQGNAHMRGKSRKIEQGKLKGQEQCLFFVAKPRDDPFKGGGSHPKAVGPQRAIFGYTVPHILSGFRTLKAIAPDMAQGANVCG